MRDSRGCGLLQATQVTFVLKLSVVVVVVFQDRVSLFLCVALAVLELTLYTRLASKSQKSTCLYSRVLGLKVCAPTAQLFLISLESRGG